MDFLNGREKGVLGEGKGREGGGEKMGSYLDSVSESLQPFHGAENFDIISWSWILDTRY